MKSNKEIEKIIANTVFSMEMEGFTLTPEEKDDLRRVFSGEVSYAEQLQKYIENAKRVGKSFDYTEWQRDLYADMTTDEIFTAASEWAKKEDSRV